MPDCTCISQAVQSCCTVVRPMQKSIGKWEIRQPVKSKPLKISSWNFAYVITLARWPTMQILVSIGIVGASPQTGEMLTPCDFLTVLSCPVLSCPYLFSRSCTQGEPLDRFSCIMAQTTCFRPRMVLLGVRTMGDHIWGKYAPKIPKIGVNRQFKAKTEKYKNAVSQKL